MSAYLPTVYVFNILCMALLMTLFLNANCFFLTPFKPYKCDHHQISPCNMNTLQNTLVIRIRDMITQDESN